MRGACLLGLVVAGFSVACGDTNFTVITGTGTGTGGEGGNNDAQSAAVGVGGMNGSDGAGGDETGAGGHGGDATGQGGSGGAGGEGPALCPAPKCIAEGDAGINCDPACGELHQSCDNLICLDSSQTFGFGTHYLRLPLDKYKKCGECGVPVRAGVRLALGNPDFQRCVQITGPDGSHVKIAQTTPGSGEYPPNWCDSVGSGSCAVANLPTNRIGWALLTVPEPNGSEDSWPDQGAIFKITVKEHGCSLVCNGGCNGSGDPAP